MSAKGGNTVATSNLEQFKRTFVHPSQLISMNDYPPLHSPEALTKYYNQYIANQVNAIPPIPILPLPIVLNYFVSKPTRYQTYELPLRKFVDSHPDASYFKVDGTHRSTAGFLTKSTIPAYVITTEEDIQLLRRIGVKGLGTNLQDTLQEQEQHYFKHKTFWTLEEKASLMIHNGDIPATLYPKSK